MKARQAWAALKAALKTMTSTSRDAALAALALGACAEPAAPSMAQQVRAGASLFAAEPDARWPLPNRLREISGLATTADGRLFAHDDERAFIYEIDVAQGAVGKRFALGDPAERGDFEGLAITSGGAFWMTTSEGVLYRFSEGAADAIVSFETFDTGLGQVCEIEGLAYLASEQSLILACKRHHARDMRDTISLYAWSPERGGEAVEWLSLAEADVAAAAGVDRFRPSSLEIEPQSGRILLLAAQRNAFVEVGADGAILAARALAGAHRQPEGVAILTDGALIIADEGGDGSALLSRYPAAR